jgi:3-dehydroquinate synthase
MHLTIHSNIRDYPVYFHQDTAFFEELTEQPNSLFIIDNTVWELHLKTTLQKINPEKVILQEVDENLKTLESVQNLYEKIMHYSPKKNLNLISIGGGIVQDITGFVASTLYRGINWIFVPTTLLAQTDSCIGAKTSLNYNKYKNLIGTFYPPKVVHIYPQFLKTQKEEDFYSGVGEMAKLHLMGGEQTTTDFLRALPALHSDNLLVLVKNALHIKKDYIEEDEFDTGRRNMLNYGHCFGHAIETATSYGIPHGQAVVIGMIMANLAARERNILSAELEEFIRTQILNPILKTNINNFKFNIEDILLAMTHDKKNIGNGLALIMFTNDYQMIKITDMSPIEAGNIVKLSLEYLHDD